MRVRRDDEREHPRWGFFVDGLRVAPCASAARALEIVRGALRSRRTGSHAMNARSSRSHCMVTVFVDAENVPPNSGAPGLCHPGGATFGSISLVDLAGSERPKATGSEGQSLKEAGHINKSLYTLGKVIRGLSDAAARGAGPQQVPFRDSKLTKLLISSLGGHCKTLMVGCVSSSSDATPETLRTLDFAMRIRGIRNRPVVQLDPQEKLINELRNEVQALREENAALRHRLMTAPGALGGANMLLAPVSSHAAPDGVATAAHAAGVPLSFGANLSPSAAAQLGTFGASFLAGSHGHVAAAAPAADLGAGVSEYLTKFGTRANDEAEGIAGAPVI